MAYQNYQEEMVEALEWEALTESQQMAQNSNTWAYQNNTDTERCWILCPFTDQWIRNPLYEGEDTTHPEMYED